MKCPVNTPAAQYAIMDNENGRRGACDRCRGQKLRCVGSGKPISNSTSRFMRNEIPCDRCKRAKVECYSVRPASRRPAGSDRNLEQRTNVTPPSSERSSFPHHHRGSVSSRPKSDVDIGPKPQQNDLSFGHPPRSHSVAPHSTQQNDRQSRDPDLLSTMPTISNEWMTYLNEDGMEGHDFGLETSSWIESNPRTCQDPVTYNMVELMNQAPSVEWNSDQFELDTYTDQIEPPHPAPSRVKRKLTSPDRGVVNRPGQTGRSSQLSTETPESTKSCLQKLAKFNEMLLREKSSLEDALTQKGFESNRRSIGQTLHHCQEFFSILKGIKYSCQPPSDSSGGRTKSDWSFLADGRSDYVQSQPRQSVGSAPSCSSGRSLSTSLTTTPSLEIPTLLSILFCYTYLLQSYDDLFISILDAVTRPTPTIPPTLSELRIDGFELDGHNTLQLECLINVSYNLLEKIENILLGSAEYAGLLRQAKGGFLGDKLFAGLIDALYEPNEQQHSLSHGNGKREVRAKRLIREIQAVLKVIDL